MDKGSKLNHSPGVLCQCCGKSHNQFISCTDSCLDENKEYRAEYNEIIIHLKNILKVLCINNEQLNFRLLQSNHKQMSMLLKNIEESISLRDSSDDSLIKRLTKLPPDYPLIAVIINGCRIDVTHFINISIEEGTVTLKNNEEIITIKLSKLDAIIW